MSGDSSLNKHAETLWKVPLINETLSSGAQLHVNSILRTVPKLVDIQVKNRDEELWELSSSKR